MLQFYQRYGRTGEPKRQRSTIELFVRLTYVCTNFGTEIDNAFINPCTAFVS